MYLHLQILFQNESPRWLVEQNRFKAGRVPDDLAVQQELDEIIADFRGREKLSLWAQIRALCSDRTVFYRFSLGIVLMFWQQWTGTNSINYYSPQIFKSIGLAGTSAGLFATGIYGVVKVVFTTLGLLFLVEQMGRKWSLIIGGLGQAFAFFCK